MGGGVGGEAAALGAGARGAGVAVVGGGEEALVVGVGGAVVVVQVEEGVGVKFVVRGVTGRRRRCGGRPGTPEAAGGAVAAGARSLWDAATAGVDSTGAWFALLLRGEGAGADI